MKNCSENYQMIHRFDSEIFIFVVHPGKDVTYSDYGHFLLLLQGTAYI